MTTKEIEFLKESNAIEREYSKIALDDAKRAWQYALNNLKTVNIKYILDIHKLLMRRLWPDIAGKFRTIGVKVGNDKKPYISQSLFDEQLIEQVCQPMNELVGSDPKITHVNFEIIHPFLDGNGRTGRILYNIHRLKLGLPIHIIHEGQEQYEYYKWFRKLEE